MRTRSIVSGFRRFRRVSPMQYVKEVRLRRVHDHPLRPAPGQTTVTGLALRRDFRHPGHFTID